MYSMRYVVAAAFVAATLVPGAALAQTEGTSSAPAGQSQTGTSSGTGQTQASGTEGQGAGGADQEAVRQHLAAARDTLAELTKLPAASELQGEQRTQISELISNFNAFATATTDWRSKYEVVDQQLDQLLGEGTGAAAAAPSATEPAAPSTTDPAADPSGTAGTGAAESASGGLDPTIHAKLQDLRKHFDAFEQASGDPGFIADAIERILDQAAQGGSQAVGTSGSSTGASGSAAGGSVTLEGKQVEEIRQQLDRIRSLVKR